MLLAKHDKIFARRADFAVPSCWAEVSQVQLRSLCRLRARAWKPEAVRAALLIRWSGAKVAGHGRGKAVIKMPSGDLVELTPLRIAEAAEALRWIDEPPTTPVMLRELRGRRLTCGDFRSEPFERFIVCDNLWQGYLFTRREEMLDRLSAELYRLPRRKLPLDGWERHAVALYWASLKEFYRLHFKEFYRGGEDSSLSGGAVTPQEVQDSVNAQIRALTKGDVTKEAEVMAASTWRALAELDAQALEYRKLKEMSKK